MTATAIETTYAGHRFRSRLEARWAVFFDHLGIPWQYEPEGFVINGRPYLPDFLLTDCSTWIEVKGDETQLDRELMINAAQSLPAIPLSRRDGWESEQGPRLLILGRHPEPKARDWGWVGISPAHNGPYAEMDWPGHVEMTRWGFGSYAKNRRPWALWNWEDPRVAEPGQSWLQPTYDESEQGVPEAYAAARSARFEHGESGALRS